MVLQAGEEIVKAGTFLYDGEVLCDVVIVRDPILYGSGDEEDPPEVAEDRERETFYIRYGSNTTRGQFNAGRPARFTLAEAMKAAEEAPGIGSTIRWID